MSLLLDALKKAADDKQKAADKAGAQSRTSEQDKAELTSPAEKLENAEIESTVASAAEDPRPSDDGELSLDELSLDTDVLDAVDNAFDERARDLAGNEIIESNGGLALEDMAVDDIAVEKHNEGVDDESEETFSGHSGDEQRLPGNDSEPLHADSHAGHEEAAADKEADKEAVSEDSYEVSGEALAMLINKTNREVRFGRRLIVSSALTATFLIMISGGVFYYLDTQAEIADLERKHRISMQAMQAKISGEKDPDNIDVIRNLVSDAELEEKVEYVKKQMADKNRASQKNNKAAVASKSVQTKTRKNNEQLSIQKTNRTDPIEEKLDAAWVAYDAGDYSAAKENYQAVLDKEKNNRDALLGMGAIAIVENDSGKAGEYYLALLEQDPRDPIATAALSSLHFDDTSREQHEDHLLGLLQKAPQSAPLNFALGNVYAQQEKWKAAQQYYFSAWQHDADNANYLYNLAVSMDQLGKRQQAITFYESSLQKANNKQISFSRESVQKRINELSEL
jgi:thioredoxin-like negative regulator of GroEL